MSIDQKRSALMSRIRGRNTEPERILRSALWSTGLRYRLHHKTPAGRPDLVFPGSRVAVFIDGCFWHGCPAHYVRPRSRTRFWATKLRENVERDRRQTLELEAQGWRVCRFWEHEIYTVLEALVERVYAAVHEKQWSPEASWRVILVEPLDPEGHHERRHLELLRTGKEHRCIEQLRHTRKWVRPKRSGS